MTDAYDEPTVVTTYPRSPGAAGEEIALLHQELNYCMGRLAYFGERLIAVTEEARVYRGALQFYTRGDWDDGRTARAVLSRRSKTPEPDRF